MLYSAFSFARYFYVELKFDKISSGIFRIVRYLRNGAEASCPGGGGIIHRRGISKLVSTK